MTHELPALPYDYSALEPVVDAQTMKLHHDMHHAAYVKNLNAALEKHPNLQSLKLPKVFLMTSAIAPLGSPPPVGFMIFQNMV